MERLDKDGRIVLASSIQDMLDGDNELKDHIRHEDEKLRNSLSIPGRLIDTIASMALLLDSPNIFTYLMLPYKGKLYPYIETAPCAYVVLPMVTCIPEKGLVDLELTDSTGPLQVELPYGSLETLRKKAELNINVDALRSSPWSSRVALLNVYAPYANRHFLMHVFNDKANEMSKSELVTWAAKVAVARAY